MDYAWVLIAFCVGWLVSRVGLPPLVGYLGAGVLLAAQGGKSGPIIDEMSRLGVYLLLFTVGLKVRWQTIVGREVLAVGGAHFFVFGGLCALGCVAYGMTRNAGTLLGFGLAFSSTVLTIKTLEMRSEVGTYHGRLAIGILILQDLFAIAMLVAIGSKSVSPMSLALLGILLLRPLASWILSRSGHSELMLLYGVCAALGGAALAKSLGVSPELGALLAGITLAGHEQTGELTKILWGVRELLLVAFFLQMGLYGLPPVRDLPIVAVLLAALPLKAFLFFILFVLFGLRTRTAFVNAVGLASFSEFALITAAAAVKTGHLPERWGPIIGVTVMVSVAILAPLSRHVHWLFERTGDHLRRLEPKNPRGDREPTRLGLANWVVVGMGRTGGGAYKALEATGRHPVGLDADPAKIAKHLAKNRRVLYGDAEDPELWNGLDLTPLHGVLLTLPDLEAKVRAVKALRKRGFPGIVAATTMHNEEDTVLLKSGVNFIFHALAAAGERLAQHAVRVSLGGDEPIDASPTDISER
jgi:predicted Kef-type K+ transport protein